MPARRLSAWAALALFAALLAACNRADAPGAQPESQTSSQSSDSESAAPTLDKVAQDVEELLEVYDGIATGAIVLVHVGEDTRVLTGGLADVRLDREMQPDDRFPVQSITKSMVATAVLQLVADGRLGVDDTVEDVVPGLLSQGRRITIRHLLSHQAGLHAATDEELPPLARTTRETLIKIASEHPLEFEPASRGEYSNVGYEVLGKVVEKVTGKPLGQVLEQNVFGPAGMTDTALLGSPSVNGYFEGKEVRDPYIPIVPASGGVISTVEDVDRFYTALWAGGLLDPHRVATMTEPLGVVAPFNVEYGLGIWFNHTPCGDAMGHSGAGPGFNTKAWTLPDASRSVVVVVNDSDGASIAEDLALTVLCP
jgi:D-alanyl-D-alanine carboxypeptidase